MAGGQLSRVIVEGLQALLEDIRAAVGAEWVIDGGPGLSHYRDPYAVLEDDPFRPAAVACPASVEQVQAIVRAASRHRQPLWPVSTGRNLGYGGPAPGTPGAVLLDLSRMKQILEVSERLGYAVVEPGVTYDDLHRFLAERGSRLCADVPDLGWGGLVGSTLERGTGYGPDPYADHWAAHCGMEVVMADGSVLRTGMGALPGSTSWPLTPYGYGPYLDGLFSQGNFGIVTKLGILLRPRPAGYRPFLICFPRESDLGPVVEIMRPLRMAGILQNRASVRSLLLEAAAVATKDQFVSGGGPVPRELYRQVMLDLGLGMWNLYGAQYGPQAVMDAYWAEIRDAFGEIPDAQYFFADDRPPGGFAARARRMAGVPGLSELKTLEWSGIPGGHVNISLICPAAADDVMAQYRAARDLCRAYGQDYIAAVNAGSRALQHVIMLIFSTEQAGHRRRCRDLASSLITTAAQAGWGVDRAHLAFMDQAAATYSYGDGALLRVLGQVKAAVDPLGILAPGKQGIHLAGQADPDPG